jgi:phosphate starvation-inducible protein PhoH and related proteins
LGLEHVTLHLTHKLVLHTPDEAIKLLGRNGEFRKYIQQQTPVRIVDRGSNVVVIGDATDTKKVGAMLDELLIAVRNGHTPTRDDVVYAVDRSYGAGSDNLGAVLGEVPSVLRPDIAIKPRTHGQKEFMDAVRTHEIVFVIGPAGTGKTFLAMAAAVSALLNKDVERLVLTRPAVEAGEHLGFLPGDLKEKVDPYLIPLYDALNAMVDVEKSRRIFDREQVEVAPLAYMRGRTLAKCFAILDEAQNTTPQQMKMFLTRLGEGSRAIITGDVTQIDLPSRTTSGLVETEKILKNTEGVAVVHLQNSDIVRHRLVQNIVDAYDEYEAKSLEPFTKEHKA